MDKRLKFETAIIRMNNKEMRRHEALTEQRRYGFHNALKNRKVKKELERIGIINAVPKEEK